MIRRTIDDLMKLVDDIGTARVQRFRAYDVAPDDELRHRAADARVKLLREKLKEHLERL